MCLRPPHELEQHGRPTTAVNRSDPSIGVSEYQLPQTAIEEQRGLVYKAARRAELPAIAFCIHATERLIQAISDCKYVVEEPNFETSKGSPTGPIAGFWIRLGDDLIRRQLVNEPRYAGGHPMAAAPPFAALAPRPIRNQGRQWREGARCTILHRILFAPSEDAPDAGVPAPLAWPRCGARFALRHPTERRPPESHVPQGRAHAKNEREMPRAPPSDAIPQWPCFQLRFPVVSAARDEF